MIEEIILIQVEGQEQEQPAAEEEGEHMQDQKLAQQIEKLIKVTNMELE